MSTEVRLPTYQRLNVQLDGNVAVVELARPEKANAFDLTMWHELRDAMHWLDATPAARVGILRGAGAQFTSGIDLAMLAGLRAQIADDCDGALAREAAARDRRPAGRGAGDRALPQAGHRRGPRRVPRRRRSTSSPPATSATARPMPSSR